MVSGDLVLRLRDFIASREDPRIVLLDVRLPAERVTVPLENRFFAVIRTPRTDLSRALLPLATLVGQRHVVVIDGFESRALEAVRLLRSIEVDAAALEDGLRGWMSAVVEESCEDHDAVQVVSLSRVVSARHSYLLLEAGEAIVINPSGCVDAFLAAFQRHHCRPIAVIETTLRHRRLLSCGPEICALTGVPYYDAERAPARVAFATLTARSDGVLAISAADVCLAES